MTGTLKSNDVRLQQDNVFSRRAGAATRARARARERARARRGPTTSPTTTAPSARTARPPRTRGECHLHHYIVYNINTF